jgi:hypothetical protein
MDILYRRGETNQSDGLSRRPDLQQLTGVDNDELAELIKSTQQWEAQSSSKQLTRVMHITKELQCSSITMLDTDSSLID